MTNFVTTGTEAKRHRRQPGCQRLPQRGGEVRGPNRRASSSWIASPPPQRHPHQRPPRRPHRSRLPTTAISAAPARPRPRRLSASPPGDRDHAPAAIAVGPTTSTPPVRRRFGPDRDQRRPATVASGPTATTPPAARALWAVSWRAQAGPCPWAGSGASPARADSAWERQLFLMRARQGVPESSSRGLTRKRGWERLQSPVPVPFQESASRQWLGENSHARRHAQPRHRRTGPSRWWTPSGT